MRATKNGFGNLIYKENKFSMKHIKKFNEELNLQTYLSASKKLKEAGHKKRSKKLLDHIISLNKVDRLDPNKYEISYNQNGLNIDGIFQIVDVFKGDDESDPYIGLSNGAEIVEISFQESDGRDSNDYLWIRSYDISDQDKSDYEPYFRFLNRKDARNFRQFIIDEFGECPISINYMYYEE